MFVPDNIPQAFVGLEIVPTQAGAFEAAPRELRAGLFVLGMRKLSWGRASAPAGVAPEALEE